MLIKILHSHLIKRVSDEESFGVITDSSIENDSEKFEATWDFNSSSDWWEQNDTNGIRGSSIGLKLKQRLKFGI